MFEGNTQDELCIGTTALKIYENNSKVFTELTREPIELINEQYLNTEFRGSYEQKLIYTEQNNEFDFNNDNRIEENLQNSQKIIYNNSSPKENSNKNLSKICRICGDKALAINYSILSCEACKAFFRRNALRNKNFKCPFNNKCEVDIITRRFCQKCRLRKCFELGMKKEWILSDEEKKLRRLKIEQNKIKRKNIMLSENKKIEDNFNTNQTNDQSNELKQVNFNYSPTNDFVFENRFFVQPANSINLNTDHNQINESYQGYSTQQNYQYQPDIVNQLVYSHYENYKTNPDFNHEEQYINNSMLNQNSFATNEKNFEYNLYNFSFSKGINDTINPIGNNLNNETQNYDQINIINQFNLSNCDSETKILDQIFEQAVLHKFSSCSSCCTIDRTKNYNNLELSLINELFFATKDVSFCVPQNISPESVIFEIVKITDFSVRKGIQIAKKISFFKNLCEEDQISLLKGCCTEMLLIKSIQSFDETTELMVSRKTNNSVKLDILKNIKEEIYFDHKSFILSFKSQWRNDETLISILMAIVLFQSDGQNIIHRSTIKYIQTVYYYLLKRHLNFNYTDQQEIMYNTLKQNFSILKSLNEKYIKTYLELNSDIIGPLLIELFDFNC